MIGLVVITHGDLADGITTALHLILGEQEQYETVGLYEGLDFEVFVESVKAAVVKADGGQGVLILTDLLGASPYNAAAMNMTSFQEEEIPVRVLTGVNLPMLLTAASTRESFASVDELYEAVMEEGRDGIREMKQELENGGEM